MRQPLSRRACTRLWAIARQLSPSNKPGTQVRRLDASCGQMSLATGQQSRQPRPALACLGFQKAHTMESSMTVGDFVGTPSTKCHVAAQPATTHYNSQSIDFQKRCRVNASPCCSCNFLAERLAKPLYGQKLYRGFESPPLRQKSRNPNPVAALRGTAESR